MGTPISRCKSSTNPSWLQQESPRLPSLSQSTRKQPEQGILIVFGKQTVVDGAIGVQLAPPLQVWIHQEHNPPGAPRVAANSHPIGSAWAVQYPLQASPLQPRRNERIHPAKTAQPKQDRSPSEAARIEAGCHGKEERREAGGTLLLRSSRAVLVSSADQQAEGQCATL